MDAKFRYNKLISSLLFCFQPWLKRWLKRQLKKTFTLEALRKMSKSDFNLENSLHIVVSGLTKPEIIDKIISTGQTPQTVIEDRLISVGDTHELEIDEGEITIPLDPNITTDVALDRDWKVKLILCA